MQTHILCAVRDARVFRDLQRMLDDGETCSVEFAADGRLALERCAQRLPDLLVIDAVLPGLDGLGVMDALRERGHMPRVIGGAATQLAWAGFERRGAQAVLDVPWKGEQVLSAIQAQLARMEQNVDWNGVQAQQERACALLAQMGMRSSLKGFIYLASAAALACENESRLFSVGERLYRPIAARFATTPQSVERLIRHAVERTMDESQARGVYAMLGNTIDPARGKPTNAQMIAMLVQRLRVEKGE